MSSFQNKTLINNYQQYTFSKIVKALVLACEAMVKDYKKQNLLINNMETDIRNCLLEEYLKNDEIRHDLGLSNTFIRFEPESPENYNPSTHKYAGVVDIRVTFIDRFYQNQKNDYYIVECKRLDGTKDLNKKYIEEGVCRFTGSKPKYLSLNNKNIMLGFIVKDIKKEGVVYDIAAIHKEKLSSIIKKNITITENESNYCLCESSYNNNLVLSHIFYNVSKIIA